MLFLSEYEFGYADANKEYNRIPDIFKIAFCDNRKIVNKLINSYNFLLVGRKGVGKSAYCSKIRSLSTHTENLNAFAENFSDFEFNVFAKTGIDNDITGTQKYKKSWDFLLLVLIYKELYKLNVDADSSFYKIYDILNEIGFPADSKLKNDVMRLSKIKVGVDVISIDLNFSKNKNNQPKSYLERIDLLIDLLLENLNFIKLDSEKIIIVIDGLDDILRYKKNKIDIIASLIRSVDYLNDKILASEKKIKIILLIREDIVCLLNDPDLNKIIQDGAEILNWNDNTDGLKEIVKLRFLLSGVGIEKIDECWDSIFPKKIRNKNSWEYVLDYTLYKPRDVLQFLKYCQKLYPNHRSLTLSEMQAALKTYSNKYFIEEMKNELSGFVNEDIILVIPQVFRKLGQRAFKVSEISASFREQLSQRDIDMSDIKALLLNLFEAGYIGQLISNGKNKESVVFKYRNPTARIDYSQKFITHRGLHSGLGVRT
ncbi:P-loop ATPase, Sll1717 family [Anaerosinus sp.]